MIRYSLLFLLAVTLNTFAAEYEFSPLNKKLTVEFNSKTQAGQTRQRLEVRQLTYLRGAKKQRVPTSGYYLIFYRGKEYGPEILTKIQGHSPLIRKSNKTIEIYYIAGAKTHFKQTWTLDGQGLVQQKEEQIRWDKRPDSSH